jgi:hypothetical protein
MQPDGSLPCAKKHTIGPYRKLTESASCPASLITTLILSYLYLAIPSGPFPSGFPTKIVYASVSQTVGRETFLKCFFNYIKIKNHKKWESDKIKQN